MTQWGLDTIFNPGKRHMDEEKRRLQSTREEIGDSSGGRRIDLESGRVTIRKAKPSAEDDGPEDAAEETPEDAAEIPAEVEAEVDQQAEQQAGAEAEQQAVSEGGAGTGAG